MFYRLSNTAKLKEIEFRMERNFRFPEIYRSQALINGLEENNLPVITMEEPGWINHAIWGILPEDYEDDWALFQNVYNTLNVSKESLESNLWYGRALELRRCLVICTGFFTNYLFNGDIYPYFVHAPGRVPFCLGGVYNQLEDGFLTFSIIIVRPDELVRRIQMDSGMPLIIVESMQDEWLNPFTSMHDIHLLLEQPTSGYAIQAHPIAKEFYKNEIIFDSMLEPVNYRGIP